MQKILFNKRFYLNFIISMLFLSMIGCKENIHFIQFESKEQERLLKQHYDNALWQGFLNPKREKEISPDKVIEFLALKQGSIVADIGAGSGFFTFRLAKAVGPEGIVYAVDVQPEGLAYIQKRMADSTFNPYNNIRCIVNEPNDVKLSDGSLDLAFLCDVHFYRYKNLTDINKNMIESIYKAVKPRGRLVIIEKKYDEDIRSQSDIIKTNFKKAGFRFIQSFNLIKSKYFLVFRKPS